MAARYRLTRRPVRPLNIDGTARPEGNFRGPEEE